MKGPRNLKGLFRSHHPSNIKSPRNLHRNQNPANPDYPRVKKDIVYIKRCKKLSQYSANGPEKPDYHSFNAHYANYATLQLGIVHAHTVLVFKPQTQSNQPDPLVSPGW